MSSDVQRVYSLDASVLFDMFDYYPEDTFAPIWEGFDKLIQAGRIMMVEQTADECKDDHHKKWLKAHRQIIVPFSPEINEAMLTLMADLQSASLELVSPRKTKNSGDPFVIAAAMAYNASGRGLFGGTAAVLSSEKPSAPNATKVKIPNVCARHNIPCLTLIDMMRVEGWKVVRFG